MNWPPVYWRSADKRGAGRHWSPNRFEWVLTQFATARVGLALVNFNPAFRLGELEYALNKVGWTALVAANAFKASDYAAMIRTLAPELERCDQGRLRAAKLPHLRSVIFMDEEPGPGAYSFETLRNSADRPNNLAFTRSTNRLVPAMRSTFNLRPVGQNACVILSNRAVARNEKS